MERVRGGGWSSDLIIMSLIRAGFWIPEACLVLYSALKQAVLESNFTAFYLVPSREEVRGVWVVREG